MDAEGTSLSSKFFTDPFHSLSSFYLPNVAHCQVKLLSGVCHSTMYKVSQHLKVKVKVFDCN